MTKISEFDITKVLEVQNVADNEYIINKSVRISNIKIDGPDIIYNICFTDSISEEDAKILSRIFILDAVEAEFKS